MWGPIQERTHSTILATNAAHTRTAQGFPGGDRIYKYINIIREIPGILPITLLNLQFFAWCNKRCRLEHDTSEKAVKRRSECTYKVDGALYCCLRRFNFNDEPKTFIAH